jgi:hypothetical protein
MLTQQVIFNHIGCDWQELPVGTLAAFYRALIA